MSSTAANESPRVGWIGLGSMGLAMALNIQKHLKATGQPNLYYWNRTISKGEELGNIGGEACTCTVKVAEKCGVTFISVSRNHTRQLFVLTYIRLAMITHSSLSSTRLRPLGYPSRARSSWIRRLSIQILPRLLQRSSSSSVRCISPLLSLVLHLSHKQANSLLL